MTTIPIGAKLAVAPVARATPLFLPRPEITYINVVHYSAPPRTYLLRATPLFRPLWRHCKLHNKFQKIQFTAHQHFLVGVIITIHQSFWK